MRSKYIFVTGGVLSSLGKGIAAASIGNLLEMQGYTVQFQKLDPYLNIDPGTMNPGQHGEVYVTDDGAETDLDFGHYERFTNAKINKNCNYTSGKIYESVLSKERKGEYGGETVQIIPHITNEIKNSVLQMDGTADIIIVELGGTVGDIEGLPFIEAVRQLIIELGNQRSIIVHLTIVPYIESAGETKTKPTQRSVRELLSLGLRPDFIVCRSAEPISCITKKKIALFCSVIEDNVISAPDVDDIYRVPQNFAEEEFDVKILRKFGFCEGDFLNVLNKFNKWRDYLIESDRVRLGYNEVNIVIVAKYLENKDTYKSINESLHHASVDEDVRVNISYVDAEDISNMNSQLECCDGILVPGGFGNRGIDGKIQAITYARQNNIPFFGICLGMQLAIVEFAQNVCEIDTTSEEFNSKISEPIISEPIIYLMEKWFDHRKQKFEKRNKLTDIGGTMRLGAYPTILNKNSKSYELYRGKNEISERHRHRYEFNNRYRAYIEKNGMMITGTSPDNELVEIIELKNHPWFVGCQFHPEFNSKPMIPHPLFKGFVKAAKNKNKNKKSQWIEEL